MANYLIRRLLLALLISLTVSIVTFSLIQFSGDLARTIAGPQGTAEDVRAIALAYGLDKPLWQQYLTWIWHLLQGNLGVSIFGHVPVSSAILSRLPVTLTLSFGALTVALLLAIPLGVAAAYRPKGVSSTLALLLSAGGQAMPAFWLSLLLIWCFGVQLRWLPITGTDSWRNFVMPIGTLAFATLPPILRLVQSGMSSELNADYVRAARAQGIQEWRIRYCYALRNALAPVVSVSMVQLGSLLAGSLVIEAVFAMNGLGYLAWVSLSRNDYPVVMAVVLLVSLFYIVLTLIADLLNLLIDPRLRRAL